MKKKVSVFDCSILELPRIKERCGNITPIHGLIDLPFEIARVFICMTYQEEKIVVHMLIKNVNSF